MRTCPFQIQWGPTLPQGATAAGKLSWLRSRGHLFGGRSPCWGVRCVAPRRRHRHTVALPPTLRAVFPWLLHYVAR